MNWKPTAAIEILKKRAAILNKARHFFAMRDILEVETPLLSHATVTDPHIQSIPAIYQALDVDQKKTIYLQTSPEYAMKRLLAAGVGPIFQITKAFRQGEQGQLHNPEFTLLEWYRPGFDHHALMNEVEQFLQNVLNVPYIEKRSVQAVYETYLGIDPHCVTIEELMDCARRENLEINQPHCLDKSTWLDILFSHCIEPKLGKNHPMFIYDFPVCQAALAKIRDEGPKVASRFEMYFKGAEIANGFHELQDPAEQRLRFENDLKVRAQNKSAKISLDERFLAALSHGLPDCAGVALGIDRLIMKVLDLPTISSVLSFAFERA